jgi:hypothetical protein
MKKLFISFVSIFIFIPSILGMNELTESQSTPEIPYDMQKRILLDLAQNIHCYVDKKRYNDDLTIVSRVIRNVGLLNKDLYKALYETRNNPKIARSIITNLACKKDNTLYFDTASQFTFPGAKRCLELTHQLYDENLTPTELEKLFKQGAILNYATTRCHQPAYRDVLSYWCCYSRNDQQQAAQLLTKLLQLGVKLDSHNFSYVINNKNIAYTKIMAPYATITNQCWAYALDNGPDYIKILIEHSQPKDLDEGLKTCVGTKWWQNSETAAISYNPEAMKQLINAGADTSIALNHLINELSKIKISLNNDNHPFYQNFIFLCKYGAFNQKALDKLIKINNIFDSLISAVEKNNRI